MGIVLDVAVELEVANVAPSLPTRIRATGSERAPRVLIEAVGPASDGGTNDLHCSGSLGHARA